MPGLSTWMLPLFVALCIVQRSCCSMACKMRRAKGDCGGWGQHSAVYCRLEMSNRFGWVCLHMHLAMVANRRKRETEFTVFADRDHAFVSQGFLPFLCRSLSLSLSAGRYCLAVTCRVVRCSQMDRWTSFVISFSAMRQPGFVIHKLSHHQSPSEVTFDCQSCGYSFSANFARFISFSHASEAARR